MFGASAQSTEPTIKRPSAVSIMLRRPKESPSRPYTGAAIVLAIRYDTTTQEIRSTSPKSAAIDGQRGGDDGLVGDRQKHRQHDRGKNRQE